jgi:hypothetical protein
LLVLAAVPVLVLTFFFFALMLAMFAVVAAIGAMRIAWDRYRGSAAPPSRRRARQSDDGNTFTVEVRDVTDRAALAEEIQPRPQQPPPSSPTQQP